MTKLRWLACTLAMIISVPAPDLAAAGERTFVAELARSKPFVPADAWGQAKFRLSGDGGELEYKIEVGGVQDITQAHIHLARDALRRQSLPRRIRELSDGSTHGPIVAFLMPFAQKGVTVDGDLTAGVIRVSDLSGPLRGYPLSLLIEFIEKGDAYVAVHVLESVAPDRLFCCPVGLRGTIQPGPSQ